jgi:hypothetical protein
MVAETARASMTSASLPPAAAFNKIRARVCLRAALLPLRSKASSISTSSSVSVTRYLMAGAGVGGIRGIEEFPVIALGAEYGDLHQSAPNN